MMCPYEEGIETDDLGAVVAGLAIPRFDDVSLLTLTYRRLHL